MKALTDYVHSKGLKIGIYTSQGPKTCAGYEGSYGHIRQDAQTFADWGFDYLKHDLCSGEWFYHDADAVKRSYLEMGRSEEHTSELQSLMRISYAVFCLKKKNIIALLLYIEDIYYISSHIL